MPNRNSGSERDATQYQIVRSVLHRPVGGAEFFTPRVEEVIGEGWTHADIGSWSTQRSPAMPLIEVLNHILKALDDLGIEMVFETAKPAVFAFKKRPPVSESEHQEKT